jgi:hypothetical protein
MSLPHSPPLLLDDDDDEDPLDRAIMLQQQQGVKRARPHFPPDDEERAKRVRAEGDARRALVPAAPLPNAGFDEFGGGEAPSPCEVKACPRDLDQQTCYNYVEPEPLDDPDFCFWSLYALTQHQAMHNKRVDKLKKYHFENRHSTRCWVFIREMQRLYNKYARPFMMDPSNPKLRKRGPPWPAASVWNYTLHAVVSPEDMDFEIARTMGQGLQVMAQNGLFESDGSTDPHSGKLQRTVNLKVWDAYCKGADKYRAWSNAVKANRNGSLVGLV